MRTKSFELRRGVTAFDCDLSILGDSLAVIIVLLFFLMYLYLG